ncbi:MAG: arsenate reductase ArsC [Candidatus Omnitrophota bacterium]
MSKNSVLFVCIHNSARSQMAEAFLKNIAAERFSVESAGLEPGKLNPVVVEVMKEIGIDLSNHKTKSVDGFLKRGVSFDYVITVCDDASGERCPMFPGKHRREHWSFADPSALKGSWEEKLAGTRVIRDQIKKRIQDFIKEEK